MSHAPKWIGTGSTRESRDYSSETCIRTTRANLRKSCRNARSPDSRGLGAFATAAARKVRHRTPAAFVRGRQQQQQQQLTRYVVELARQLHVRRSARPCTPIRVHMRSPHAVHATRQCTHSPALAHSHAAARRRKVKFALASTFECAYTYIQYVCFIIACLSFLRCDHRCSERKTGEKNGRV
uniref:Uncharacterized protein n=1 Tax=Trichogramma kaykai TaxID=54128 RepID=A0ABD2WU18_9HYME